MAKFKHIVSKNDFARSVLFKSGHKLVDTDVSEIDCFNRTIFCERMVKCSTHEA